MDISVPTLFAYRSGSAGRTLSVRSLRIDTVPRSAPRGLLTYSARVHDTGTVARSVPSVACLNRRLFVHPSRKLTRELLETAYGDAVDALGHDHGAVTDEQDRT